MLIEIVLLVVIGAGVFLFVLAPIVNRESETSADAPEQAGVSEPPVSDGHPVSDAP